METCWPKRGAASRYRTLSERTWPGTPRRMNRSDKTLITSTALSAGDPDRQALVGELVEDVEHPVLPSIMGTILDKVVGPDVVGVLGPQPQAGAVRQPEPATPGLLFGDLEPLAAPDPLHPLVVDHPAGRGPQQLGGLAVAVAAVLARKLDDVGRELFLVVPAPR